MLLKSTFLTITVFCVVQFAVSAQCLSSFKLTKSYSELNRGELTILVDTSGPFECYLFEYTVSGYKPIESIKKSDKEKVVFKSLNKGSVYKVEMIFDDDKELCHIRQIGGITF